MFVPNWIMLLLEFRRHRLQQRVEEGLAGPELEVDDEPETLDGESAAGCSGRALGRCAASVCNWSNDAEGSEGAM